uniref:Uncharacterized protein n=1 Tax=termite gut metagenome TaxID=433724 RepID=S0DDB3_9ZZZZ
MQNAAFIASKFQPAAGVVQGQGGGIQHGAPVAGQRGGGGEGVAAAQGGLHLGHQHRQVEGFGDEVVGALVQGGYLVHVIGRRGDKQDGYLRFFADFGTPVEAAAVGQGKIQQHQLRGLGAEEG